MSSTTRIQRLSQALSTAAAPTAAANEWADKREVSPAELSHHDSNESAWLAVDGHVYDVTSLLDSMPAAISTLRAASGTDASALFGEDSKPLEGVQAVEISSLAATIGALSPIGTLTLGTGLDAVWAGDERGPRVRPPSTTTHPSCPRA
jgi:hypothetical protein